MNYYRLGATAEDVLSLAVVGHIVNKYFNWDSKDVSDNLSFYFMEL